MNKIALVVGLSGLIASVAFLSSSNDEQARLVDSIHEQVRKRTYTPATAEFPGDDIQHLVQSKDNTNVYLLASYVDVQNRFGAKVRENYLASAVNRGNGDWEVYIIWKNDFLRR